ncbi:cupin domain-containing protein [Asticcacaulis excentricus]|uniref:Cupin 2 conserved barrel domain protein n=1 Tax=Asticcacaulis excentricus (strain ATCC 15261 / DSM 4724 / KCTC 12464 / NCIMB 9791 / VKM B-1370 / CB 48) TaxID=573065 RepID=E8RKN5_ASTEC|nr:cupin domain-containing protein [Asticcacaulis excentricus]ADU13569.1 Cupin 2 conserved barrel domain protein [Asticcacaulis excentricus CB 48]
MRLILATALIILPSFALGAPPMVIIDEKDTLVEEAPPHGRIGMSTAYRISDKAPQRSMEFRKRSLHKGAAIGIHPIGHDEVYYVVSGTGIVESDGVTHTLTEGMTAYLYEGAKVGIKQVGDEPLTLIISYPLKARTK